MTTSTNGDQMHDNRDLPMNLMAAGNSFIAEQDATPGLPTQIFAQLTASGVTFTSFKKGHGGFSIDNANDVPVQRERQSGDAQDGRTPDIKQSLVRYLGGTSGGATFKLGMMIESPVTYSDHFCAVAGAALSTAWGIA